MECIENARSKLPVGFHIPKTLKAEQLGYLLRGRRSTMIRLELRVHAETPIFVWKQMENVISLLVSVVKLSWLQVRGSDPAPGE